MAAALSVMVMMSIQASGHELDQAVLDQIVAESERTNSDALIVLHDGEKVFDSTFGKPVRAVEAMSATKSIVSMAIGLLVDRQLLPSIDEPVSTYYPEWKQGRKRSITVRHLLTHVSGLQNVPNAGTEVEIAADGVQLALCAELDADPGAVFSYNNKATNLLAGIVEKASGMKLDDFLRKHLFAPLGIENVAWRHDRAGNPIGMAGLGILPGDLARIGQLILNRGRWNERQIVSEEWLRLSFAPSPLNGETGLLWWLLYERQYMVIDDAFLAKAEAKAGPGAMPLLSRLKGRYKSYADIRTFAKSTFTPEELAQAGKALSLVSPAEMRIENEGAIVGYAAVGYLGQQLIVLPGKNLVIVRMISAESHRQVPGNSEFAALKQLAKQL